MYVLHNNSKTKHTTKKYRRSIKKIKKYRRRAGKRGVLFERKKKDWFKNICSNRAALHFTFNIK